MPSLWEHCWKEFNDLPSVREKERVGRKLVLGIVLVIWLITTLLHYAMGLIAELLLIHAVGIFFLIGLGLRLLLDLYSADSRLTLVFGFITDILLTFLFIGVTGGFSSPFLFLPLLYLLVTCILHGLIQGVLIAVLSSTGYSGLFLMAPLQDWKKYIIAMVFLLLTFGIGFFLCYLGKCRDRKTTVEIEALQALIKEKEGQSHSVKLCSSENLKSIRHKLTEREWEVAFLAAKGFSNKDIAEKLAVAEVTVKKHLGVVFEKLDLSERRELTRLMFCERIGLSEQGMPEKVEIVR